jgi:hypothetical protein
MLRRFSSATALPCLCAALLLACGSSKDDPGGGSGNAGSSGHGGATGHAGNGGSPSNGGQGNGGSSGTPQYAGIQMRVATTAASGGGGQNLLAFTGGGAVRPGLESLEYYIYSVQICESLQASGSGFSNPTGCLELYSGDRSRLAYELDADWTPLADAARALDDGFINLLDTSSRQQLERTTELRSEHVRSYNYGVITWSLPIKVKATLPLGDGTFLYTHDGETQFETIGNDNFKRYYTKAASSLGEGPAEKAVVLLGNGGNWFKFQNPLTVTSEDVEQRRQWVLDLVFNPEGIVKGFAGDFIGSGNLEERNEQGTALRTVNVPMLDLAPIPHRQDQQVVRESYLASLNVGSRAFDVRLELYSVEGDPNHTIYGADVKTLVTSASSSVPPEIAKISYVVSEDDGLSFQSFKQSPLISGFSRVTEELGTTPAVLSCATHDNREGAEGGAAIVLDSCPAANIDVTFRLVGRTLLDGELPNQLPEADAGPHDGGVQDAGTAHDGDAGADAAL